MAPPDNIATFYFYDGVHILHFQMENYKWIFDEHSNDKLREPIIKSCDRMVNVLKSLPKCLPLISDPFARLCSIFMTLVIILFGCIMYSYKEPIKIGSFDHIDLYTLCWLVAALAICVDIINYRNDTKYVSNCILDILEKERKNHAQEYPGYEWKLCKPFRLRNIIYYRNGTTLYLLKTL